MIKLFRYLKPYIGPILLTIVLLFIQVNTDLALPDYMSRIVNVGIQQQGIENSVPVVIRSQTYQTIYTFSDEENREVLDSSYRLLPAGTKNTDYPFPEYPAQETEDLYFKRDDIEIPQADLESIFNRGFMILYGMAAQAEESGMALPSIEEMPAGMRQMIFQRIEDQMAAIDPAMFA